MEYNWPRIFSECEDKLRVEETFRPQFVWSIQHKWGSKKGTNGKRTSYSLSLPIFSCFIYFRLNLMIILAGAGGSWTMWRRSYSVWKSTENKTYFSYICKCFYLIVKLIILLDPSYCFIILIETAILMLYKHHFGAKPLLSYFYYHLSLPKLVLLAGKCRINSSSLSMRSL